MLFEALRIFLVFLTVCILEISSAQSFLNGSFETTPVVGDQINMTNAAFNVSMANTYAFGTYGDMDIITSAAWGPPQSGSWYVALTGAGTDMITMQLNAPLVSGTSYTITFWDRGYSIFPVYPVQLGLSTVSGAVGTVIYTGPTPTFGVWNMRTATFVAPNNGQYISVLMTLGTLGCWVNIDNFSFPLPLPLELLSFSGENINNINQLQWTTASGINADYFIVERSSDGILFHEIGTVTAGNLIVDQNNFAFSDDNPINGVNYYRLKIAGRDSYSDVIALNNYRNDISLEISPNPASTQIQITISASENITTAYTMCIINLHGENIITANVPQHTAVDISSMPAGIYYVTISDATGKYRVVKKLVKVQTQ